MNNFEKVSMEEFKEAIAGSSSVVFKKGMAEYDLNFQLDEYPEKKDIFLIHHGPLTVPGNFEMPGFYTLVLGDLTVEGLVDLVNPEGFDEGGVFAVLGNVSCKAFSNQYGKLALIDGNLEAKDIIINSFEDSALLVSGNLKTKFFYGIDIWADVGGTVEMEYGNGYCFPIGYTDPEKQAIEPQHDKETSMGILAIDERADGYNIQPEQLKTLIKEGKSIFK